MSPLRVSPSSLAAASACCIRLPSTEIAVFILLVKPELALYIVNLAIRVA